MTERRAFIKKSLLGGAGIAVAGMGLSAKSYASILGANDRINLAVIGIRGQGGNHINQWCNLKDNRNVRIRTLCDVDEQFFAEKSKVVVEKSGVTPLTQWDMRRVFDDPEIDAVNHIARQSARSSSHAGCQWPHLPIGMPWGPFGPVRPGSTFMWKNPPATMCLKAEK